MRFLFPLFALISIVFSSTSFERVSESLYLNGFPWNTTFKALVLMTAFPFYSPQTVRSIISIHKATEHASTDSIPKIDIAYHSFHNSRNPFEYLEWLASQRIVKVHKSCWKASHFESLMCEVEWRMKHFDQSTSLQFNLERPVDSEPMAIVEEENTGCDAKELEIIKTLKSGNVNFNRIRQVFKIKVTVNPLIIENEDVDDDHQGMYMTVDYWAEFNVDFNKIRHVFYGLN